MGNGHAVGLDTPFEVRAGRRFLCGVLFSAGGNEEWSGKNRGGQKNPVEKRGTRRREDRVLRMSGNLAGHHRLPGNSQVPSRMRVACALIIAARAGERTRTSWMCSCMRFVSDSRPWRSVRPMFSK